MSPGGRIKDSDVEAVRERTDIVRLISEFVPLKKSGREFRGPCPFHQEKDPSFYVNPAKGVYFCFGCKASGGIFNFVMQMEGLSFNEAVERLADRIGYQITYEAASRADDEKRTIRDRLYRLNQTASEFFHYVLKERPEGRKAMEYLSGRGFAGDTVEQFHLGFAPAGWDKLSGFLTKKGFTEREIVTAGLARERGGAQGSGGRGIYDMFRNRIIFPIQDNRGRFVAFGGRRMPEEPAEGEPKYLNSPETPVYRKGYTLYGFYQARGSIQDSGRAVIVEGYTDLLSLWQAGLQHVVATLGTALTENHFDMLNRFCDTVYIAFDADRAGVDAARRPIEFFNRFRLDVYVVNLPEGEDPASLVEKGGIAAFEGLREAAEPLLDFAVRRIIEATDISTPMGRRRAMERCVPVLAKVSGDDMLPLRNDLVRKIGSHLDMPVETVNVFLRQASQASGRRAAGDDAVRAPAMWEKVEREAIRVLMQDPEALAENQYLDSEYFTDEGIRKIFEMLKEIALGDEELQEPEYEAAVSRMVENIEDSALRGKATRLLMEPRPQCEDGEEEKVFERLSYMFFERRKRRIEDDLRKVDQRLEPKKYDALWRQLIELDQVIKEQFPYDHG